MSETRDKGEWDADHPYEEPITNHSRERIIMPYTHIDLILVDSRAEAHHFVQELEKKINQLHGNVLSVTCSQAGYTRAGGDDWWDMGFIVVWEEISTTGLDGIAGDITTQKSQA